MATLNKEYNEFDGVIKLTSSKKESLRKSSANLRTKIKNWFKENKPNELQPKFHSQGSMKMNTSINPIVEYDDNGDKLYKYDLDDGIYFIEKDGEDNKKSIDTWHNWVFQSVDGYTNTTPIRKTTCIRVVFADGHNIDLPIYYNDVDIELAHRSKGWILSDPKAFYQWFNNEKKGKFRLEAIVRCLKAWKNFREINNSSLSLPSGFELTILATNNYVDSDNLDDSFRLTAKAILEKLKENFECYRPTTPDDENLFENYSPTRRDNFMSTLESLVNDCEKSKEEENFKKASEILRNNQFGDRFPLGKDEDEKTRSNKLSSALGSAVITPKPYGNSERN